MQRTTYCGLVTKTNLDQEVTLYGWVDRRRDHGGVIFLDLRDREGIVQVVFDPDAGIIFFNVGCWQAEHSVSGSSLIFCKASCLCPQASQ